MSQNRKNLITKFLNEGFTYRTLSLFSDDQLTTLSNKLFVEQEKTISDADIQNKEKELAALYLAKAKEFSEANEEEVELTPNNEPITKVEKDGKEMTLLGDGELDEDFASKKQQRYLYATNKKAADKLASKMTPEDYKNLPEKVTEQKMLESWLLDLVSENEQPSITKATFLKTVKEHTSSSQTLNEMELSTPEQEDSFNVLVELGNEMEPPLNFVVDGFEEDGHLNGYLKGDEDTIDVNICPEGNIKLNGNPLGGVELAETDRDNEGEYIGAPEATTAPAPLKTPTIAPSRPGEKKRRGPFERPKTTPKPKAKNKSTLPDWLTSTNLGKALTQHG